MGRIENERAHFKNLAPNAEKIWGWSTPAGALRAQRRAQALIQAGRLENCRRILEIGCGTGIFTEKMALRTTAAVTAIDLSDELLTIARTKNLKRVTFQTGDAMQLPFESSSFDAVVGNSILHHLEIEPALREVFRVLQPNGRAVFAEPNLLNPQIFIQKNIPFVKKWMGDSPDESAIVRWRLARLMRRIGFQTVHIFPFDFLHPATPSFLIAAVRKLGDLAEKIPVLKEIAGSVLIYGEK